MNGHGRSSAGDVDIEALQRWVGRSQTATDDVSSAPLAGLAALLDHEVPPWTAGQLPPLGHWLYFLEHARQSTLDVDGHAKRGEFLPPVPLPRRMWAAGRVRFVSPIPLGASVVRRSTIAAVTAKSGRSGPLVFVTVRHELLVRELTAIIEDQDIVYRMPPGAPVDASPAAQPALRQSDMTRSIVPGAVPLFRFSALTFNAHRIHYDRDYATNVEGYPGLVVHGPLIATLLMDHFLRQFPGSRVMSFNFRAERPLFDTTAFDLCSRITPTGAELWAADDAAATVFSATVEAG